MTKAAYVQLDFGTDVFGKALSGNIGVRYVRTELTSSGNAVGNNGTVTPVEFENNYGDWLPSLNAKWELGRDLVVRGSIAKVLARPAITALTAGTNISFGIGGLNQASSGQPMLKPFRATQYDIGLEYYFGDGGYVSGALFYKDINSYVTQTTVAGAVLPGFPGQTFFLTAPSNGPGGRSQGFEVGVQRSFEFLTDALRDFGVIANYTYVDSKRSGSTLQIENTSKHSYNIIGYFESGPFQARAAYNWRSAQYVGLTRGFDIYSDARGQLDASLSFDVTKIFSVTLEGSNLLETPQTNYSDYATRKNSYIVNDRSVLVGVRARFLTVRLRPILARLVALAAAVAAPAAGVAQAIPVAGTTQLFLDDHIVERRAGLERVQARPSEGQVVLANDAPWEQRVFYPEVVRTPDGRILMFYNAGLVSAPMMNVVSVAESRDGKTFTKPKLGFFSEGGASTNIVYRDAHGPGVVLDPSAAANARWKMAYFEGHKTTAIGFAGSDLRFRPSDRNPLQLFKADTKQGVVWDPATRKWLWFTRIWEKPQDGRAGWTDFKGEIRSVARFESSDFIHWTGPETVLRRSAGDPELSDFYGLQVIFRHGIMIGLLWTSDWADAGGRIGRQRAELVTSRDSGRTWTRVDPKRPFFQLGTAGHFDSEIVWPSSILTVGDKDLIYYLGANRGHGMDKIETFPTDKYRIGMRAIGRDRFVGMAAGRTEGQLVTKQLAVPAFRGLEVNAIVSPGGFLKLRWIDDQGRSLSSIRKVPAGNSLSTPVVWSAHDTARIATQHARLQISAHDATLFGVTFP